jgi:hypothetical protein
MRTKKLTHTIKSDELSEKYDKVIRKYLDASNGDYLIRIDSFIRWTEITNIISRNLARLKTVKIKKPEIQVLIKCIIIGKLYSFPIDQISSEIASNEVFIKFLDIDSLEKVPNSDLIVFFHQFLTEKDLYEVMTGKFYNQLLEQDIELAHSLESVSKKENKKSEEETIDRSINDRLYAQMNDLFFNTLDIPAPVETQTGKDIDSGHLMEKLQRVDEYIKELKTKVHKEEKKEIQIEEPIELHPKFKKEGIFNDENLTEDYELGYRFYQLGLKMGFFNVKLDNNNESSRISTAEFFPNTFWTCVKQRSRWIAGICFQNWKVNRWKGDFKMKYFLFRDRKSLFSLPSAFFSNLILAYLLYAIVVNLVYGGESVYLVSNSNVLWYLMAANVVFMISRASHRFIFTYNWYGFKYAFFSFFRLIIDTAVNFFAVLRSIDVFRKTKKKVVWDSTSHY